MEAIREARKASGHRITMELPKRFRGSQIETQIGLDKRGLWGKIMRVLGKIYKF